ncbi:tRNA modification GTPase TrmE [Agrobacterium tumefaciens]|uniref:tRNA modification GTPase MnmE n=1 Tax=Agrobacterium fabrum (strain C58 / ATCC 33970) TaxID=176299 RepID=MNME_AGRFC|nr:tRNA uridine-5-carboxymethylaminomethyl(34) synthesis GTPase MnmE [Agrobacterium fabrum]A9CHB2.1 RecName: Full=tRNA modification GTPase MnmE [Agrobacterium fabrum str. C58]KEY52559.1 tRNA modification GTPase TrmE [Agrobacterium tumefaciens]AAK88543.1 tRNA modification GTPase [Agrobacterium fabrum str. C58]KJX87477.1 tRNA modification GTPase mnmE [Agrobacterium tumefaciens]MCX2874884.1 tRNA uridine-5-carboxymethylaminomethyl(34) synthesis GTPase MnmE [Agrobacterium fabrum]NMV70541.1 tRNA ur
MPDSADTIYALSSGALPAGVAVIRISGAKAFIALRALTGRDLPLPRTASLCSIRNRNNEIIDQSLVIVFPAPNSFTGENCVEIHSHGSRAVMASIFAELDNLGGLRPADAGEFSRRAFENGKMDLLEVEGLADLLQAETEMQRRLAVEQSSGQLSALYDGWANRLTRARALIEAELDFADEEDVPDSVATQVWEAMAALKGEINAHLQGGGNGEIIRDGFKVALVGEPNAGKSTLLNALSGREVAIVTDIAGTTRDVLSVDINLDGYLVRIFDTAGIRETQDVVEREGVRRAVLTAETADLILILQDNDSTPKQSIGSFDNQRSLRVRTKTLLRSRASDDDFDLSISAKEGIGLDELRRALKREIEKRVGSGQTLVPARARHKKRLEETLNYVSDALDSETLDLAIRSEYLRLAATSLGRITGRVDVEDLLGVIFSEFCIGK